MGVYTPTLRRRARPNGRFEVMTWYLMRVSGVVLLFVAVGHLLWLHLVVGLENIDFNTIVGRWTGPLGAFWRVYDLVLLMFAMTHGLNGARWVIDDYVPRRGPNWAMKSVVFTLGFILILMGAFIIFTFRPAGT
ncbi:MAG: succinate dehydrogenase [Anaerolineae bacterium]|nr:succinate dehydrogenase [Anaerolineae bacterium]